VGRPGGRVRIYYESVVRDLELGSKRAEESIDGVGDAAERTNTKLDGTSVSIDKVDQSTTRYSKSARSAGKDTDALTKKLEAANIRFTSLRNAIDLIKWPGLITGAGYAAQGVGELGAGAVGLTSALAPLSGALAAYPALLGSVGQAAGVLALTQLSDLKEALGGNEEALKKLSPQARSFLEEIKQLTPEFKRMRSEVQSDLFGGLTKGLKAAEGNFGVVQKVMTRTADVMGHLGERAGELIGSKGFGRDFLKVGQGNAAILGRMGTAGLKLADALRHVMVSAQPLLTWMSKSAVGLATWIDEAAKAGRESGRLSGFFGQTRGVIERLSSIVGSLAGGFLEIGHAAAPLGRSILAALDNAAQGFEDWTKSIEGKNALRDYFAEAKPGIFEMGRLIRDVAGVFLKLSTGQGLVPLTHQIRTELVPVLGEVLEHTTRTFGPHLVHALVEIAKLFGHLAGSSGPLTLFVDGVARAAHFANVLLEKVPGLNGLVVTFAGAMGVAKAVKFTAAITGVSTLIGWFGKLKDAAITAKIAEEGAATPGLLGGKGLKGKIGGALGLGSTAATTVGPLGMLSGEEVAAIGGAEAGGGLLAAAPAAGPWLAVAAAVAATAGGLVLLYKNSKTFRDMVAPLGKAATDAFAGIKAQLAPLGEAFSDLGHSLGGRDGFIGQVKLLYKEVKGPIDAIGAVLRAELLIGIRSVFNRGAEIIRGFGQIFAGQMQVLRGVVEVITGVLTLKFGKAWQGVKDIFSGGAKAALGYVKVIVSPITGTVKAIGETLGNVFGKAWDKVKGIFEDGANAVIGFVQDIADVINLIPGVPDIHLPTFGGGDNGGRKGKAPAGPQGPVGVDKRYTGGPINRPMAIVGEEAPQHPEWVIATNPRYRKSNIAYWMQAGRDLGVPGFFSGGDIVSAAKGTVSAAGNAISGGAGFFIDKLPKPHLPSWLGSLGSYAISHVADYIKNGFQEKKFGSLSIAPSVTGYTGPPANMKQLGDNRYVDSHTLAVTAFLDKMFGLSMSSGFRSVQHNAEVNGAPGSLHTHGSPANPGATDSVGPMARMRAYIAFAKQHVAGLKEAMVDNVGNGWNAHLGFFATGGKIDWNKLVGTSWDNDELATLAHIAEMSSPGFMAQLAQGESSGNAHAVGDDEGGTEGLGLWQITTGYNDALIAKYGGRSAMFDPLLNARAAAEVLASQGTGAWYAPATGPRGKVDAGLAAKIRAAMGGEPVGEAKKPRFPAGHTGKGGGTYGSPAGLPTKPPRMHETKLPGLPSSPLPPGAKALPPSVQSLLRQPGLTYAQKLSIGGMASSIAGGTREKTFDASGKETSADSHADDIAAAKFQKNLVQQDKKRVEKRLREIASDLKKKGLTTKQRNKLLGEQNSLLGRLGSDKSSLSELNQTIHAGPEGPEGSEEGGENEEAVKRAEEEAKRQEQIAQRLQEIVDLQKQENEEKQRALDVSQSQYGVLAQAVAAVVSGQIGGQVGLGFQTPSVAGSLASY
jgi:Transglycosylase SLT domain/Peptidase M15